MPILWREAMSVDGGAIDRDHQVLIAIINEFEDVPPIPGSSSELQRLLLNLDTYTKKHFVREEALQKSILYPYYDSQHQEHIYLIDELNRVRSELSAVKEEELSDFHARIAIFLRNWLIDHVVKSDLKMKPFASQLRSTKMSNLQERSNLKGLSILIVDDEPFMRTILMAILRAVDRSFVVTVAGNGETALRLITEKKPDLVMCDIEMEPMNGQELVERLRNHTSHELRTTAVIMVTAHSNEATIQRTAPLNIKGYLVKPVSPKQLEDLLYAIFQDRPRTFDAPNNEVV